MARATPQRNTMSMTESSNVPTSQMSPTSSSNKRVRASFLVLGLGLLVYVATCTVQRENNLGSDGWEHHRTILTLTRHLWKPGNPTYASDIPSVRYSPYTVFWAVG